MRVLSRRGWTLLGFGVIYLAYVPFWIAGLTPWIDLTGSEAAGWLFWLTILVGSPILGNVVLRRRMRKAIVYGWEHEAGTPSSKQG